MAAKKAAYEKPSDKSVTSQRVTDTNAATPSPVCLTDIGMYLLG